MIRKRKRKQQVFGPAGPPSSERLSPSSYYTSRFDLLRRRWGASGFIIGTLLLTMSAAAEARPPPSPQHPHHSSNNAAAAVTPVTAHHTAVDAAATAATVATSSSQTISSQSAPAPLASSKHQETEEAGTGTHLIGAEAKNKKTKKAKTKASTNNNKKKKNKPSASTRQSSSTSPSKSRSSSSSSGHANTATMLRVQREWKDLIQAGVAFDWNKGQPVSVTRHEKKRHEKKTNNNKPRNIQPQDIWLGPVSLREWWVWHFSFQGVPGSSYAGGIYHGRILLPPNYPAAPPRIHLLTPTGRFVPGTDICLSQASAYHPETWQPSAVRLRTLVEGVRWHMLTNANEIGGVTASLDERRRLARSSREFAMTATRRGNSGTAAAAASTVVVDHGRMLREGWIVLEEEEVEDDETRRQEEPVATTAAETASMGKTNKIAATRSDETVEQAESKVEIQQDAFEDGDEGEDDKRSDSNENEPLTAFVSSSATNTKRVIRSQQGFRNDNTHSSSHRKKKTMTKSRRKKHHKTAFGAAAAGAASGDATVAITQRQQYPNRALSIFGRFLQKHHRWVLLSFCFLLVYLERNIYYWISG